MAKKNKVLIAVNDSDTALKAVQYVGEMSGCTANLEICLLSVASEPPPYYYLEGNSYQDYVREKEESSQVIFAKATEILEEKGIDRTLVSCRTYIALHGETISEAILAVRSEEGFYTIVVGKRGVSKSEEFVFGSISNALAHHCHEFAVWVVG